MYSLSNFKSFIDSNNYDIRTYKSARWIDQKCTPDVVRFIAACIINYISQNNHNDSFSINDIWNSEYSNEFTTKIFNKPSTGEKLSNKEYDKFFAQPINLFNYMGILEDVNDSSNRHSYVLNNTNALHFISMTDINAADCLYVYINKVIKDSRLDKYFDNFFNNQTNTEYSILKEKFSDFTIKNTNISKKLECNRIFSKILNILAYEKQKLGTKRGRLSKSRIGLMDLNYNQINFRDLNTKKPKELSRKQWEKENARITNIKENANLQCNAAKNTLRNYNSEYRDSKSEIKDDNDDVKATQMHHIFMKSENIEISMYLENIIAITPDQHLTKAHPNNNTSVINKSYQKKLLIAKFDSIYRNITDKNVPTIYSWKRFYHVLEVGLNLDKNAIKSSDYKDINSFLLNF